MLYFDAHREYGLLGRVSEREMVLVQLVRVPAVPVVVPKVLLTVKNLVNPKVHRG